MIAPDLELPFLDRDHIAGWLSLALPPGMLGGRFALLVLDGGAPVRLVVRGRGAVPLDVVPERPTSHRALAELRRALDVGLVIALETEAMGRLVGEIEAALVPGDDYVAQGLAVLRALRHRNGKDLWCEPRLLDLIPPLAADPLQRTFDLLVPDRTTIVAYCVDERAARLHASLIAYKEGGALTAATTHRAIEDALDGRAIARDLRGQVPAILRLVEDRFAPPSIGVFFERGAFYRIAAGPPDQLHAELARRSVILEPTPPWLRALVGGAAAVAAATSGARTLARFLPASARKAAQDLAAAARAQLDDAGLSPFALLGFDPLELWRDVRHFYRDAR